MAQLLVLLLVTGVLAGAEAGGCSPGTLAAQVAHSCAAGAATPACCEPLLASGGGGGGDGGGDCLCPVSREVAVVQAGLNASGLVALYAECGGAAASISSKAHAALAATVTTTPTPAARCTSQSEHGPSALVHDDDFPCDSPKLASQIFGLCKLGQRPSPQCCEVVAPAVDIQACACSIAREPQMVSANFTASVLVDLYTECGGAKHYDSGVPDCTPKKGVAVSRPPPPAMPHIDLYDEHLTADDRALLTIGEYAGLSQACLTTFLMFYKLGKLIYRKYFKHGENAAAPAGGTQAV